jgi:hypothetical protein
LVAVAEGDIAAFFWRKGVEGAVDTGCCGALVLCVLASLAHWRYPKKVWAISTARIEGSKRSNSSKDEFRYQNKKHIGDLHCTYARRNGSTDKTQ